MFFTFILFPHVSTFLLGRWRKQWRLEIRSACSKPWAMRMRRSFSRRFNGGVGCLLVFLLRSFLVVAICCKICCHIFATETMKTSLDWGLWWQVTDRFCMVLLIFYELSDFLIFFVDRLDISWYFQIDIENRTLFSADSGTDTGAGVASGPWGGTAAFGSNIISVD